MRKAIVGVRVALVMTLTGFLAVGTGQAARAVSSPTSGVLKVSVSGHLNLSVGSNKDAPAQSHDYGNGDVQDCPDWKAVDHETWSGTADYSLAGQAAVSADNANDPKTQPWSGTPGGELKVDVSFSSQETIHCIYTRESHHATYSNSVTEKFKIAYDGTTDHTSGGIVYCPPDAHVSGECDGESAQFDYGPVPYTSTSTRAAAKYTGDQTYTLEALTWAKGQPGIHGGLPWAYPAMAGFPAEETGSLLTASVTLVTTLANLSLTVTRNAPTVHNAQIVRYTIALHNAGPDAATDVKVSAKLASYLQMATRARIGDSLCTTGGDFICRLKRIGVGATESITFRAIGLGPLSGHASQDVSVHVGSGVTDPNLSNNHVSRTIKIYAAVFSNNLPVDPAYPFWTGKPAKGLSGTHGSTANSTAVNPDVVHPAVSTSLPADCPRGIRTVPVGDGSVQGCFRPYCGGAGQGSTGDGFAGIRVDAWESGHSGVNQVEVDYKEQNDQTGQWSDDDLSDSRKSGTIQDDNGTHWFVVYFAYSFSDTAALNETSFRIRFRVKFLHRGTFHTSSKLTGQWIYPAQKCQAGD